MEGGRGAKYADEGTLPTLVDDFIAGRVWVALTGDGVLGVERAGAASVWQLIARNERSRRREALAVGPWGRSGPWRSHWGRGSS